MKRHGHRGMTLLLELIIAVALFAVAGAVCAQVLVTARQLSDRAELLDTAVEEVTSAAELLRSAPDPEAAMALLEQDPDLTLTCRREGTCLAFWIGWSRDGKEVYALELLLHEEVAP